MYEKSSLIVIGCLLLVTHVLLGSEALPVTTTVIEDNIPKTNKGFIREKDETSNQSLDHSALLQHIPGLTYNSSGGPLNNAEIRFRGLSSLRYLIDVDGLSLSNPMNGLNDANSMFLFAAKNLSAQGLSLSINLPDTKEKEAKGVVGFCSQSSYKVGTILRTPITEYAGVLAAIQLSGTDGDFSFSSADLPFGKNNNFTRQNNDQKRLQGILKFTQEKPESMLNALVLFNLHEGGTPGFAFSPTPDLRTRMGFVGIKLSSAYSFDRVRLMVDTSHRFFNYRSSDNEFSEKLLSTVHELSIGLKPKTLPAWIDFDLYENFVVEHAYELNKTRFGGGFSMNRVMRFKGKSKPVLNVHFNMMGFDIYDFIFKKRFALSFNPSERLTLSVGYVRNQRAPTFMELYANNRFYVGNPALKKESIWDMEFLTEVKLFDRSYLRLSTFMGFLTNAIINVPYLATRLRPVNADSAKRYGLDINFASEPTSWLALETTNSLLKTKMKETGSPLPHSPPFVGSTKIRLGRENLGLTLQTRYRTGSFANNFSTLRSNGYVLLDALVSATPHPMVNLSLSVTNIFNVKNARDSYEIPLPGTVFFGQIELGSRP